MDAGCECAPWVRSANPSDSWALVSTGDRWYATDTPTQTIQAKDEEADMKSERRILIVRLLVRSSPRISKLHVEAALTYSLSQRNIRIRRSLAADDYR